MTDKNFAFWVELRNGEEVRWSSLTRAQAVTMYNNTDRRQPDNVRSYGWEEMK